MGWASTQENILTISNSSLGIKNFEVKLLHISSIKKILCDIDLKVGGVERGRVLY